MDAKTYTESVGRARQTVDMAVHAARVAETVLNMQHDLSGYHRPHPRDPRRPALAAARAGRVDAGEGLERRADEGAMLIAQGKSVDQRLVIP
jgi:hypothetical protein